MYVGTDQSIHKERMEIALRDLVSAGVVLLTLLIACPIVAMTAWYQSFSIAPFGTFLMIIGTGMVAGSTVDLYLTYRKAKMKWEIVRGRLGLQ